MSATAIDTAGFTSMLRDLVQLSGTDFKAVMLNEVARVLEVCIRYSPGPDRLTDDVRQKTRLRVLKPSRYVNAAGSLVPPGGKVPRPLETPFLQTMTGTRGSRMGAGGQWFADRNAAGRRVFLSPFWHLSNVRWATLQQMQSVHEALVAQLDPKAEASIAAIGSLRKSWLQIADQLGVALRLEGKSYLRRASSAFDDGARSRLLTEGFQIIAELVNTNTALIQKYDGAAILRGALATRELAFQHELEHAVFENLKLRASRHPGVFVT